MTEQEARAWLDRHGWWTPIYRERLEALAALLVEENGRQNLVAASTLPHLWARHIVDSAQLLTLAESRGGVWVDLGSGGGFPGLVIACLREEPLQLIEVRNLRVDFLARCVEALELPHARVVKSKVENVKLKAPAAVISARAFASLTATLSLGERLGAKETLWLLPKGRNAEIELASAREEWQALFHVEQSVTDAESAIVTASGVSRIRARSGRP